MVFTENKIPMKIFIKTSLFSILIFAFHALYGQHIQSLRLQRNYNYDNLDKILDEIGKELNVRIVFDRPFIAGFKTSFTPLLGTSGANRENTLGSVLKTLRDSWDMVTLIGDDGYVYIAKDREQLAQLQRLNNSSERQKQTEEKVSRSVLTPVKRAFTLTGEVFDVNTKERIPYATVSIENTTIGATTDANGRFTINRVPADTCTVLIRYIGYISKNIALKPEPDNTPLTIDLEPQPQDIATVFVIGRKDDKALQQYTGEHKMKMAPEALKLLPNVGEKDILRGFQLMPGVSASNESSSGMYVRGGTPDQNLILYDGFTVYYVDHLHGFYSAFNSNAIKDVQLYKGGFESKYGGRLSSVTEITAKEGNKHRFTIGGEISLLSMNAYAELPLGDKFTSLFAFRRSYQGYLWNKISGQNKVQEGLVAVQRPGRPGMSMDVKDPPAYFYDLNGKITYTPTGRDIISLSIFNGTDYIDNTQRFNFGGGRGPGGGFGMGGEGMFNRISMDNADFAEYGNFGSSARWTRKITGRWSTTLLASYSNFYATRDQRRSTTMVRDDETETTTSGTLEKNNLSDATLKNDWQYRINDRNSIEFGTFATKYNIRYDYTQNGTDPLLDKRNDALLAGLYLQDKIYLTGSRFVITPGVRINYFSTTGGLHFEPRLGGSYRLTNSLTLNAATGIFNQFANRIVREDIMAGNTDFWILSDGHEIPVSRSNHFNVGINYDLPNYIFSIEGYYKRNLNISEYTLRYRQNRLFRPGPPGGGGGSNTQVSENFYVGDGYATGIEFLAQKKAGKFSGWVSYTLGEVKNRFPELSGQYYFASQDVTHEVKMVGIYKFGNFDLSATWIYSTGRPYTAPIGAYRVTSPNGIVNAFYAVSDKNTFRLPDYHRLDLAANFRFNMFGTKGRPNAISFSLFNLYNRRNVSAKQFEIVEDIILESNINYLSITPNFTLTFKF